MSSEAEFYSELIEKLNEQKNPTYAKINQIKQNIGKKYKNKKIIKNAQILAHTKTPEERKKIIQVLNSKPIRELSGVTVVALFAKPHACPHGKCIYCPGGVGSIFGDTPQSYTGQEPAALRARRNLYDPYLQIFNRLEHYVINGHFPDKLELIFMGGTFPSLDKTYKDEFVNFTYKAINDFAHEFILVTEKGKTINYEKFFTFFESEGNFKSEERVLRIHEKILTLKNTNITSYKEEIKRCETAPIRPIGLTIETKPDWALEKHCSEMLEYGCTRLELGVQTLNEECLKKTNRGHTLKDTQKALQVSKDMCFKINAHMMLGLPASTLEIDEQSLKDLFLNPLYRPDMLKLYPCLVTKGTPLYELYKRGQFTPIDTKTAAEIIARAYVTFPRYVRVMRVQRDIPTTLIEEGIRNSNLRQYVDEEVKKLNITVQEIRSREIGQRQMLGIELGTFELKIEEFEASSGKEFFIDVADENDTMIGFIRLRFPSQIGLRPEITKKTALIRELHIYGLTTPVGEEAGETATVQHKGWGTKLVKKAEDIAKKHGYEKMIIISGIGVREYYAKLGYSQEGPYMSKLL